MGYRTLLASYMHHVEGILGTNLVEVAAMTSAVNERDLGELRSIAAQLRRESFERGTDNDFNRVVHQLLAEHALSLEDLAQIEGFNPGKPGQESVTPEEFSRILLNLVEFQSDT